MPPFFLIKYWFFNLVANHILQSARNQDDGIIAVPHSGHLVERHGVPLMWGVLYPHFGQTQ